MAHSTFIILWKFRVKKESIPQFEKIYGPHGEWARLFQKSKSYIGTELYKDATGSYLTVDEWVSREAYEKFKEDFVQEYRSLDAKCEDLTEEEIFIGSTVRSIP